MSRWCKPWTYASGWSSCLFFLWPWDIHSLDSWKCRVSFPLSKSSFNYFPFHLFLGTLHSAECHKFQICSYYFQNLHFHLLSWVISYPPRKSASLIPLHALMKSWSLKHDIVDDDGRGIPPRTIFSSWWLRDLRSPRKLLSGIGIQRRADFTHLF